MDWKFARNVLRALNITSFLNWWNYANMLKFWKCWNYVKHMPEIVLEWRKWLEKSWKTNLFHSKPETILPENSAHFLPNLSTFSAFLANLPADARSNLDPRAGAPGLSSVLSNCTCKGDSWKNCLCCSLGKWMNSRLMLRSLTLLIPSCSCWLFPADSQF